MSSTATLFWGLLFGSFGAGYFIYGKKQRLAVPLACGILLMAFPYFISSTIAMILIGAVLTALPYFIRA
ncbi:MAG: hypothetical protein R3F48_05655 [Candidatus Zixiibacteriota bacterium]